MVQVAAILVLWWGEWRPDQFEAKGGIMQMGNALGDATNNYAEAQGMAIGIKELVRLLLRITTRLASSLEA